MIHFVSDSESSILGFTTGACVRGLAAISIMLGHYLPSAGGFVIALFPGHVWVGIFFLLSGYGLKWGEQNKEGYLDGFLRKRLASVYLPFCIAELVYGACMLLRGRALTAADLLLGVVGIKLLNSTLWYVLEILAAYMLFLIVYRMTRGDWVWIPAYFAFLLACVYLDVGTCWYISTSCFVLGVYACKYQQWLLAILRRDAVSYGLFVSAVGSHLSSVLMSQGIIVIAGINPNWVITALQMMAVLSFTALSLVIDWSFVRSAIFERLGGISYEIYLLHMAISLLLGNMFGSTLLDVIAWPSTTIACALAMSSLDKHIRSCLVGNRMDSCK